MFGFMKVDDIKIKMKVSLLLLHCFICFLLFSFPFFLLFSVHGLKAAFRSCEIKVKYSDLTQIIDTVS